ncbi:MerR family DNA-binding transcriptional regulator [Sphaerimonospora sp. CA-214678]|uniref:MerR family DNA-binding transcriptional regulator n=1 Tax=Sphaerimonospora sp. CA-214678 TaxID=3240029 RepID=UPI003D8E0D87
MDLPPDGTPPAAGRSRGSGPRESRAEESPDEDPPTFNIGDLARQAGVSTRTIRYYEELGILPQPERTVGGTRRYSSDYLFYLEGARMLKQLGFGLVEISELGRFALTGAAASTWTKSFLQEKVSQLDHRIRVLTRLHELVRAAASSPTAPGLPVPELLRWVSERSGDLAEHRPGEPPRPSRS